MVKDAELYYYWSSIKHQVCYQVFFSFTEQVKSHLSEEAFCTPLLEPHRECKKQSPDLGNTFFHHD